MILGLLEHENGVPIDTSLEMLTLARDLADGGPVEVVAFGPEGRGVADHLGEYGVDAVHHVKHNRLDSYAPDAWAESIVGIAEAVEPEAVLGPGSDRGQEVLARVGTAMDLPMAADCIDVETGETYEVTRHRWGGSLIERARLDAPTKLLTVAAHELPAEPAAAATEPVVEAVEPSLEEENLTVRVDHLEESDVEGVPLGEARVVVGGGRGVEGPENYDQLEELADHLGGAVGASRAAVNEGWRPHDDQIGLTGTKITPDIYFACGISGAVQHMVGCKGAENILAINTDPEAAIMQKGDYAVIGDLHEVVPELNEAIREHS
ncbi:MAG: electron transfer flavoprotein subunit alpha/FixB family protein [Halobacteriales archaeon]